MDPITHGIIGVGVAAMSGEVNLMSPITLGAVLGAMSPDIDILAKYKGTYEYMKHHRGETHSLLSAAGLSFGIAAVLKLMFPEYNLDSILIWTFLGTMSHIFFDALNSYGVKPLLPFKDKRYTAGLIMLYDPFLSVLSLVMFFSKFDSQTKTIMGVGCTAIYIAFRYFIKKDMHSKLSELYDAEAGDVIHVLPSLINFFKWDYVVEKKDVKVRGRINFINEKTEEIERFYFKEEHARYKEKVIEDIYSTELGRYFEEFTSSINHVDVVRKDDELQLDLIDLRYYMNDDYMHHASFIYDDNMQLKKAVFRPYKYDKAIVVNG